MIGILVIGVAAVLFLLNAFVLARFPEGTPAVILVFSACNCAAWLWLFGHAVGL